MTIFTDKPTALDQLNVDHLALIPNNYFPNGRPGEPTLWRLLMAAEEEVSRKIGVPLEPTRIFSVGGPTADELTALDDSPYLVEPGYDLDGNFAGSWQWATLQLNKRPLISVEEVKFVYPGLNSVVYVVPPDWIYPDRKYAQLQFTAAPTAGGLPVSIVGMNAFTQGRSVPQMVRVKYTAGLTPQHPCFLDVRDLVMRMAVIRVIKSSMPGQSSSISADGLSQSVSFDIKAHADLADADLADLRERILGLVFGVI